MKPSYDQLEADCAALKIVLEKCSLYISMKLTYKDECGCESGSVYEPDFICGTHRLFNSITDSLTAHPGSSLLAELEAARKVVEAAREIKRTWDVSNVERVVPRQWPNEIFRNDSLAAFAIVNIVDVLKAYDAARGGT